MKLLNEIEILKRKLRLLADRHGDLTHSSVVRVSQLLDKKLNEYDRFRRQSGKSA